MLGEGFRHRVPSAQDVVLKANANREALGGATKTLRTVDGHEVVYVCQDTAFTDRARIITDYLSFQVNAFAPLLFTLLLRPLLSAAKSPRGIFVTSEVQARVHPATIVNATKTGSSSLQWMTRRDWPKISASSTPRAK